MWIDFISIPIFFLLFKFYNIFMATLGLILVSWFILTCKLLFKIKIKAFEFFSTLIITFFGLLTLYFKNPLFIQLKVTIIYWTIAMILWLSDFIGINMLQKSLSSRLKLEEKVYKSLNLSSILFFFLLGTINLIVVRTLSMQQWIYFKVYGCTIALICYVGLLYYIINKHQAKHVA